MSRRSTLDSLDIAIDREVNSQYDEIKKVADNIAEVVTVANLDLTQISSEIQEILDFTGITVVTLPAGGTATWDAQTKTLSVPVINGVNGDKGDPGPRGPVGLQGIQGIQGLGINHIKATSTTQPEGDFSTAGFDDTYSFYADAEETQLLGFFTVHNGSDMGLTMEIVKTVYESNPDTNAFTDALNSKLDALPSNDSLTSTLDSRDTANRDRANHTGTQSLDTIDETAAKKVMTANERTKLAGVETGATSDQVASEVPFTSTSDIIATDVQAAITEVNDDALSKSTSTAQTITSDITFSGNTYFNGSETEVNHQTVTTQDNLIVINNGEVGSGITAGEAGFEIDRGTKDNYFFKYVESSKTFRIGKEATLQAVATREDSPLTNGYARWNDTVKEYESTRDLSVASIVVDNLGLVDGRDVSVDGAILDEIGTEAEFLAALNYN